MFKLTQIRIRNKIANDPYYRFQSLTEMAIAIELGIKIDVNQAGVDDWLRLPGFSIHQARSLVELVKMGIQLFSLEDIAAAINVPLQRLQVYEPILAFAYYDRLSSLSPEKIDLNRASTVEILAIPDINADLASQIQSDIQTNGKYRNIVDLQSRLSLDRELTSRLMHYVRF
ncbi:ComEA family DNA-binding protein [Waterburya agarophytonicola K14]|uniref:ComEA family DNA-binding protein n=1 Tax=Waterburya agarophytonicola KI4 TaxID=2874699 RepID=A0A964FF69_9CYAN|nr:ComEA family DNA-binding protein [Waterburya agarophytonicola]MCC0176606.1 ComEA family DNA-binding protein [Waterburya agarophytonicola KI4]